jgi:hypothetical protein
VAKCHIPITTSTTTKYKQRKQQQEYQQHITMNDQQNVEIAEDTPQYMSVMMSPLSAPPMPRSFARQTKVQPMQKVKEPTLSVAVWTVSNLPALPAEHLLERTNVYVDCNSQEVADRICNCLRLKSIAAIADNNDKVRLIHI